MGPQKRFTLCLSSPKQTKLKKFFGQITVNLDGWQSGQANDSASIVKRAKEISQKRNACAAIDQSGTPRLSKQFEIVQTNSFCLHNTRR